MKKRLAIAWILFAAACSLLTVGSSALATNGDNLIAVGPIARSMGGVGIAAPQDAISAVFANPAAMCFGPYCPTTEVDFAGTLFMPEVDAKIDRTQAVNGPAFGLPSTVIEDDSDDEVYAIPAIGISVPITDAPPFWRFGLAAFGVSGLGVDYRGSELDQPGFYPNPAPPPSAFPLATGEFTNLQILRFAPAIAFQPSEKWSFGLAGIVDYSSLDLRSGSEFNYGFGAQGGLIYKPLDQLSFGLTYRTPIEVEHDDVRDFDGDGAADTLNLESPQELGFGIAYGFMNDKLLLEGNIKWVNWSDADGYEDFDWEDQYVFAVGAQFRATPKLTLRAGYNYAENPVDEHENFNGAQGNFTSVQGKLIPTYYYETFRIIGFPAVVEHHLTLGIGYEFTPAFALHLGYTHAFEETISETGTDLLGDTVTIESTLEEDTIDFGLVWRF